MFWGHGRSSAPGKNRHLLMSVLMSLSWTTAFKALRKDAERWEQQCRVLLRISALTKTVVHRPDKCLNHKPKASFQPWVVCRVYLNLPCVLCLVSSLFISLKNAIWHRYLWILVYYLWNTLMNIKLVIPLYSWYIIIGPYEIIHSFIHSINPFHPISFSVSICNF